MKEGRETGVRERRSAARRPAARRQGGWAGGAAHEAARHPAPRAGSALRAPPAPAAHCSISLVRPQNTTAPKSK